MKKIVIIACAVLLIAILALGVGSAMGGGVSPTLCNTLLPGKPGFNSGEPLNGTVYVPFCEQWSGPQTP